ncbi:MAG: sigma-70 family RNA polymerase sigma factor [Bacteroidota bacterium]
MQKKEPSLRQIIEGCVNKDLTCEQLLYKTFYGYVSGVAFRYLREREMIRELVNDAFLKIFNKIDIFQFEGDEPEFSKVFKGWIGKITANLAIDKIRSHKQLIYVEEVPAESIIEMSVQPSDRLSFNDIMALLSHLPPLQQVIFNMHAIEGFSHEEIAKELNMLPNTSRVYLKRAKAKLVTLYQAEENEQGTRARVI